MSSYPPENEFPISTPIFEETVTSTEWDVEPLEGEASARVDSTDDNTGGESTQATAEQARDQAKNVASDAKDASQHVAGVTKDQAKEVASEVKGQAKELISQATSELKDQAATQQQRVATGLHSVGDELEAMADGSVGGVASELVRDLGSRAGSVATWLEDRDPGALLSEVKAYAARKPGTFIAIAAAAGIVAGRLTKSLATTAAADKAADVDGSAGAGL
jgi:gas vesicle protein